MPVIRSVPDAPLRPYGQRCWSCPRAFSCNFLWRATLLASVIAFGLGGQAAAKILLEEQFRAKNEPIPTPLRIFGWTPTTANLQLPNALSCRRWELGIGRWALTRAL